MNKKSYLILGMFAIIFMFFGGTLAYWQWNSSDVQQTAVNFEITEQFSCSVDGGGDVSSVDKMLAPASCTNEKYAIQRTITATADVKDVNATVSMDLWLDINSIDTELSQSANFKYALTTVPNSCTEGVIESGSFTGKSANSTAAILNDKIYTKTGTNTYYLYVWLDSEETNPNTMDKTFSLSLNGSCETIDYEKAKAPNEPVLDDGMIPITLSSTGVATVADTSGEWYNYEEKEWANAVLVSSASRSTYLNNPGTTINDSDILAYYVWIPRYKYRFSGLSCSTVDEPTVEDYPTCYSYTISGVDKTELISFWQDYMVDQMSIEYTEDQATIDIDNLLNNGLAYIEAVGRSITIIEFIDVYNSSNETQITYIEKFEEKNKYYVFQQPQSIDIVFESSDDNISNGDATITYMTHPAFVFGNEIVSGIWVGKFETSTDETSTCYTDESETNCNNTNQEPRILPNVKSLRYQNVSNQFQTSLKFAGGILTDGNVSFAGSDTYGLTANTDSHQMKNSEWGAVAYLSHSQYGVNSEIYINNSSGFYTGRSGGNVGGSVNTPSVQFSDSTLDSENQYNTDGYYTWLGQAIGVNGTVGEITNTILGTMASTTGNITGVYDMSGGTGEYVMGVISDGNGNPRSGRGSTDNSGFNGMLDDNTEYTLGISFPKSKYYDLYPNEIFSGGYNQNVGACTLETCGGDALVETYNWYDDILYFAYSKYPWFVRGVYFNNGAGAGAFASTYANGISNNTSWRSVLIVD